MNTRLFQINTQTLNKYTSYNALSCETAAQLLFGLIMPSGDQLLSRLWYKVENPASFSGRDVLLKAAKRIDPSITAKQVELFLNKQATYLRHRRPRKRRAKAAKFGKFIVTAPMISWSCDTALFRHSKLPYLLICRDSFSNMIYGKMQRGTKSNTTLNSLKTIVKTQSDGIYPHTVYTDKVNFYYYSQKYKI